MVIRQASAEEMLALWGYGDPETATPTTRYFYRNISSGNALFWTIEHDGDLIGELYAFLDIEEDRDFADGTGTAYLCAFRVRKEFRGKGLGTSLMLRVLDDLRKRGFRRATIGVEESEEQNVRLYLRLGFDTKVKDCSFDPCARDEHMQPQPDSFMLLSKDL